MIRLIVSDVDGTLIRGVADSIPEKLIPLISEAYDRGIRFAVASGRQFVQISRMFGPVIDRIFSLSENGCIVYEGEKLLHTDVIPRENTTDLIRDIMAAPGAELWMNTVKCGYTLKRNPALIDDFTNILRVSFVPVDDPDEVTDDIVKIGLLQFHEEEVRQENKDYFLKKYGGRFQIAEAGHGWLDFMNPEAGKGAAVRFIAERMGLDPSEVAVIGDNENDISMFRYTENAYVMEDSTAYVRQFAVHTTADAVKTIEELISQAE